ncbi:MAG: heparinase II/III family protein [Treponemataceae bacterium]
MRSIFIDRSNAFIFVALLMCNLVGTVAAGTLVGSALPAHPRLIATAADWNALPERRRVDADLDGLCKALITDAEATLSLPPLEHKLIGRRMLNVSREYIRRALLRSFAWRTTGDVRFLERARGELATVVAFTDWNPSHFLDVAEMSAGVAITYDWLYADLSETERKAAREALLKNALVPARNGHKTLKMKNNWSQVCSGGLALAALAVADEESELSDTVLSNIKANIGIGLAAYAPDGVYPEGPSYWAYGTQYTTLLVAALRSALGTDWDIMKTPGLEASARFFAFATAPSGKFFNFADSGENSFLAPPLWYLAAETGNAELIDAQRRFLVAGKKGTGNERFAALIPFSWVSAKTAPSAAVSLHFHGRGDNPLAVWRSGWKSRADRYFAIKAGGAGVNHGHMDGGSFVLEQNGVRWAEDLGMQDYESLESKGVDLWNRKQNSDRWKVFRIGADSHNSLVVGDAPHRAEGLAKINRADEAGAEIDLSPIFPPGTLATAIREVKILPDSIVLIDRITGARPGTSVRWTMATRTEVETAENRATLRSGKAALTVNFSGLGVKLSARDIEKGPGLYDAPNPGFKQLVAEGAVGADGKWELLTRLSAGLR